MAIRTLSSLSAPARALLPEDPGARNVSPIWFFPGQRATTSFSGWSRSKAQLDKDAGVTNWRIHDLHRTVATGLQRPGVRLEVTEAMLNHISGSRSGIVGIYQRHEWAAEKRAALVACAQHVMALVAAGPGAGNVVALRRA
jgi:integrase